MDPPKKSNKIKDIVRLQQILKKWRRIANSSKSSNNNNNNNNHGGSKGIKFLKRTLSLSDRDKESSSNAVPKGYLAVCVGLELKRFVIPTEYLGHQAFHMLLREAEEEFGFEQTGVLRIPCEVSVFENVLKMVEEKDEFSAHNCGLFSVEKMMMGYCSFNQLTYSHHPQSPMCR
ncbi:hypothetical protein PIB30_088739 [Stylosanthes scabra]|uniref:Small auxin up regulated protein n=1 Tax=Stylosanthes scabra TaxID=79078 RepID=A0ABU6SUY4_9FABA|nr:hypothetical protein [Stylosanthes scabra]